MIFFGIKANYIKEKVKGLTNIAHYAMLESSDEMNDLSEYKGSSQEQANKRYMDKVRKMINCEKKKLYKYIWNSQKVCKKSCFF